jgi:hypothetical protein
MSHNRMLCFEANKVPINFDPGDQELSNGTVPDRKSHFSET